MPNVVLATAFGGPEVLVHVERQTPAPDPGEVVVEVHAAGVNPVDVKRYGGQLGRDPALLPMRLGAELSGVVSAVGSDAVGPAGPVRVGDEVMAFRVTDAYAQEAVVPATAIVPKPDGLAWEEAGGLLLAGVTAVHLMSATAVAEGDTVLVHAAAGGVGVMAVQLARLRGARVIGTGSLTSHDFLHGLGAEPVAYGPGLAERVRSIAPEGVTVALDAVGTEEAIDTSLELVKDRDRIATVVAVQRAAADGFQALGGAPGADPGTDLRMAARLELAELAGTGALQVVLDRAYPLVDVAEAHRQLLAGHTRGKIVLVP